MHGGFLIRPHTGDIARKLGAYRGRTCVRTAAPDLLPFGQVTRVDVLKTRVLNSSVRNTRRPTPRDVLFKNRRQPAAGRRSST